MKFKQSRWHELFFEKVDGGRGGEIFENVSVSQKSCPDKRKRKTRNNMPLPGSWLDSECADAEAYANATRILYSGCPLCLEEDTCNLCFEFKLNKLRAPGDRWATRNLKDHAPISPPETLSASRILFMEKMGHVLIVDRVLIVRRREARRPVTRKEPVKGRRLVRRGLQ
ncbi:expressed unknown protein [Seminavis robusta]|uniref:Uncharacterized protein n=1 Tax=Seminavis robusta TaxID=568900 RepID=A0A9N8HZY1_9STRA|nr:expressed unknown protein [Seminavis robusta]|eukprot:Sro4427_g353981.1  (169) ;mRNA; r:1223-1729